MTRALSAVIVVTASLSALRELVRIFGQPPGDFLVYVRAARSFAHGTVDDALLPVLTPSVVLLAETAGRLPPGPAAVAWRLLSVGAWAGTIWLLWRAHRHRLTRLEGALAFALACHFEAVLMNLRLGQVNLLVLFLAVVALDGLQRARPGLAGGALGVSLALKPLGALLLPGLLVMGHARAAITALLVGLGTFVLSGAVVYRGVDAGLWLREGLPLVLGGFAREDSRAFLELSQSLPGVLAKLGGPDTVGGLHRLGLVGGGALVLGMLALVATHRRDAPGGPWLPAGFLLTGMLVVGPLAWPYYTVMLAPTLMTLWTEVRRHDRSPLVTAAFAVALYLVAVVSTLQGWVPRDGRLLRPLEALGRSPQFAGTAILLVLQAWLIWRGRPRPMAASTDRSPASGSRAPGPG